MSEMNIFIYLAINKIVLTKCFLTIFNGAYLHQFSCELPRYGTQIPASTIVSDCVDYW